MRLPIQTRLIMPEDSLIDILEEYAEPHLLHGDIIFVSEKVVAITQGRVVDVRTIRPTGLARFLAKNVKNYRGTKNFRGFGHGTARAMQLLIEEVGIPKVLLAAFLSAITRPFGLKGVFYMIVGKRAKSIDVPMSYAIHEFAMSAKLPPLEPDNVAKRIKKEFGAEAVILDANYLGAFSLGKSSDKVSERFVELAFYDNPLGNDAEMTPFCIVRKL